MNSVLYVRRFSLNLIRDLIGNQFFGTTEQQRITVVKATAH